MVKRVQCRVISTVPTGGFNRRSGGSPEGSQSDTLQAGGPSSKSNDVPAGPYGLLGNVAEGIVIDCLA